MADRNGALMYTSMPPPPVQPTLSQPLTRHAIAPTLILPVSAPAHRNTIRA